MTKNTNLSNLPTYIFIDASNIKNACRACKLDLDFNRLFQYFREKYPQLKEIIYFEGLADNNQKKLTELKEYQSQGIITKTLVRKSYHSHAKYKEIICKKCHTKQKVRILKEKEQLKSSIDVFLCTEFMDRAFQLTEAIHFLIVSCDGDYAEMVERALMINQKLNISVLATPFRKFNNYLSIRLKKLQRLPRFYLINILNIADKIETIKKSKKTK